MMGTVVRKAKNIKTRRYSTYKNTQIDWLDAIPKHWALMRMKYLFKIQKRIAGKLGFNILSITQNGIKIKDVESGAGQLANDYSKYQLIFKGEFAMNHMDLITGYVDISAYDGVISPDYRVFTLQNDECSKEYYKILFQLCYQSKIFYSEGQGVSQLGRWRLPAENFSNFIVPMPPIEEQIQIAAFLDCKIKQIDRALFQKEQQIELLKESRRIRIYNAVTCGLDPSVKMKDSGVEWIGKIPAHWEVKRLKNICDVNKEALPEDAPSNLTFEYVDIGSVTFEDGIFQTESCVFKTAPSRARRIAKEGDTIVSTVRTYLKAIDYINKQQASYVYSTGFAVLHPISILPEYLTYCIRSDSFTNQVDVFSKGMSYPAINSTEIARLFIAVAPPEEQKLIVKYISDSLSLIARAVNLKQQEIEKLKEYKVTVINAAVTGKIKVN